MNKRKIELSFVIMIFVIIVLLFGNFKLAIKSNYEYGDQIALFTLKNNKGEDINSGLVLYDSQFKHVKESIVLDKPYTDIDQLTNSDDMDSLSVSEFILVNEETNDQALFTADLNLDKFKQFNGEPIDNYEVNKRLKVKGEDGRMILSKEDSYKEIKALKFPKSKKNYELVDTTQITNYLE